jgi:hypothetical protein
MAEFGKLSLPGCSPTGWRAWKRERKNLKNRACKVAEPSLGSHLFSGKPLKGGWSGCGHPKRE